MKGDNMKKTICILALLFLPLLLGGCEEKAKPMELPEIEVPVIEVESETESESETEFVFSDMTVYHGILENDYFGRGWTSESEEAFNLRKYRLCTTYQDYRSYVEAVKKVWPDADVYKFPDIPAEWFEEWSLITLTLMGQQDMGSDFSLVDRWSNGEVLLLTLEAGAEQVEMEDWLVYDRATFLTSVAKTEAEELKAIYYSVLHPTAENEGEVRNDIVIVREDNETIKQNMETAKEVFGAGVEIEGLESVYLAAIESVHGSKAASEAWLKLDEEGNVISDGNYTDVLFGVRPQILPTYGMFPNRDVLDYDWEEAVEEANWMILERCGILCVSLYPEELTREWKKENLRYDVGQNVWRLQEPTWDVYDREAWEKEPWSIDSICVPCSVETLNRLLEDRDILALYTGNWKSTLR